MRYLQEEKYSQYSQVQEHVGGKITPVAKARVKEVDDQ